jgi:hypothetical protein
MPAEAYWAVLYAGIASSCFAHGLNSWAISHVSGRRRHWLSFLHLACHFGNCEGCQCWELEWLQGYTA